MTSANHRKVVVKALADLCATQAPLPLNFNQWPSVSKHLLLETCRYYPRLACIANKMLAKAPKDKLVWSTIIVGLCELHILEKPAHASIHELVQIIKNSQSRFASGMVNAVLRRYTRESDTILKSIEQELDFQYAHPLWFIEHIQKAWPKDWEAILTANNQHAPMSLRLNLQHQTREVFLQKSNLQATTGQYSKACLILDNPVSVDDILGFKEGLCSVQDEAAQLAAQLLELKPNLRVLDACAAPGGKTAHILETEPKLETCIALEPQAERFEKLKNTLTRLHLHPTCIKADATDIDNWWDEKLFHRILIDAPCSGTGVIRRHPDIKLRRTPEQILINTSIQAQLLKKLWPLLAPKGLLLYATCSILPEENDEQIQKFLEVTPDAKLHKQNTIAGIQTSYGQQIFPGTHAMDGFYYALLQKIEL